MKEIVVVFAILAFSLYGFFAVLKDTVRKIVQITREIRKEKNKHEGGDVNT